MILKLLFYNKLDHRQLIESKCYLNESALEMKLLAPKELLDTESWKPLHFKKLPAYMQPMSKQNQ